MKKIYSFFVIVVLLTIISCGNNDAVKADQSLESNLPDSVQSKNAEPAPDVMRPAVSESETKATKEKIVTRSADIPGNKEPHDILINIDKYLVSKPDFSTPPASDITDGRVTVQNTLPDITFQKAILEVNVSLGDGQQNRINYYILPNIEPGDIKSVSILKVPKGSAVSTHIVKIKSEQITKGETVPVGTKYVAH